jgi:hypothetical protein
MSGQRLSQSKYALQQVVVLFGELLIQLDEAGLTHTYRDVLRYCELENINYLVLRYVNTGAGPFEEFAGIGCTTGKFNLPVRRRRIV